MKPTVYIETTIVGHLTSRLPSDIKVMSQMLETRQWWDHSRHDYDLFVSELVQQEISKGDPTAAAERPAAIDSIPSVPIWDSARHLVKNLLSQHGLPEKARADALHLAICATNQIEYLLTWNCRHLANATRRKTISEICKASGYNTPVICTPVELQEIET